MRRKRAVRRWCRSRISTLRCSRASSPPSASASASSASSQRQRPTPYRTPVRIRTLSLHQHAEATWCGLIRCGPIRDPCPSQPKLLFLGLFVGGGFFLFAATACMNMSVLESVPDHHRPFAVAFSTLLMHVLGIRASCRCPTLPGALRPRVDVLLLFAPVILTKRLRATPWIWVGAQGTCRRP